MRSYTEWAQHSSPLVAVSVCFWLPILSICGLVVLAYEVTA